MKQWNENKDYQIIWDKNEIISFLRGLLFNEESCTHKWEFYCVQTMWNTFWSIDKETAKFNNWEVIQIEEFKSKI